MQSVRKIAKEIVSREGGFVNDPDDPGGPTNHGVTLKTLKRLGIDLDFNGVTDVADVRKLTRGQATEIFLKHYYAAPKIDALPESLQPSVFDMYVNAGGNAVKILQRTLTQFGYALSVDGAIGPNTVTAANAAVAAAPQHFVDAYGIERRNYYYALGDRRKKSRKYARRRDGGKGGWIARAEEFIAPKFHLSQSEHTDRISKWV
jgi:lysozyme family protein